jgi:L-rhamnonate dehydratase
MSVVFAVSPDVVPEGKDAPIITEVRAFVIGSKELEAKSGGGADCHAQAKGHWIVDTPIANPMSGYPKFKASRTSWGIGALGTIVVEVELNNGLVGVGTSSKSDCHVLCQCHL